MKHGFTIKMLRTVWLKFGLALQKGKTYKADHKSGGGYLVHWNKVVSVGFNTNNGDFEIV